MLELIESTSRECVDVKVVPDLLQVIALRARLEDLDGVPVININDVPLQGFNSDRQTRDRHRHFGRRARRARDPVRRSWPRWSSSRRAAPVFYRQERMGLDGKPFMIVQVPLDVRRRGSGDRAGLGERRRPARARRSAGSCGGRTSTNCRSSGTCCAATCRSSARGPSARTSSSSSSTGFRSTCCATK